MTRPDPKRLHEPETLADAAFPPSTEKAGVGGEVDAEETPPQEDALAGPDSTHFPPSSDKSGEPSPECGA